MSDNSSYIEINNLSGRVFVFGDIHGTFRELKKLLNYIEKKCNLNEEDLLIFVGDYIDRGRESRDVIDLLINLKNKHHNTICLKGNHEDMLIDFLTGDGMCGEYYLENGGKNFFRSYKLNPKAKPPELLNELPEEHLEFLNSLDRFVVLDDYIIVHAGFNPLKDMTTQENKDIFWIRDEFLNNVHYFNKTIVFGHTVMKKVFIDLPYRIGIDTGLVYGGKLTCIELTTKKIYQLKKGGFRVRKKNF